MDITQAHIDNLTKAIEEIYPGQSVLRVILYHLDQDNIAQPPDKIPHPQTIQLSIDLST